MPTRKLPQPRIIVLLAFLLITAGCTRYYYQPHALPAPMLEQQHDLHLDFSTNITDDATQVNFMAAYAPINHLGLYISSYNYNYDVATPEPGTSNVNGQANLLEFGIGGFYPITEGATKFRVNAEAYGGYAFGQLRSDVDANVSRIFIQPGLNMRSSFFDLAFHIRFSNLNYSKYDSKGRSMESLRENNLVDPFNQATLPGNYLLLEPGISLMGGYKFIKAKLSIVRTLPLTPIPWHMETSVATLGLSFQLQELMNVIAKQSPAEH